MNTFDEIFGKYMVPTLKGLVVVGVGTALYLGALAFRPSTSRPSVYTPIAVGEVSTKSINSPVAVTGKLTSAQISSSCNLQSLFFVGDIPYFIYGTDYSMPFALTDGTKSISCNVQGIGGSFSEFKNFNDVSLDSLINLATPLSEAEKNGLSVTAKGIMKDGVLNTYEISIADKNYVLLKN